jgi:hypothetical protein
MRATSGERFVAIAVREFNIRKNQGDPVIMFALLGEWCIGTAAAIKVQRAAVSGKNAARLRRR